jgi:2-oxoisovalerate dehydrogenase E1 component
MAAAKTNGLVSVFLEPIALYMTKDLHREKDGLWLSKYPSFEEHISVGEGKICRQGKDITIVSYANGLWMSLRVAERLKEDGIDCTVVDLRWLNPLPEDLIIDMAEHTGKVLIVDECRKTGGMAEPIMALLAEKTKNLTIRRVTGWDTYIPLGDAANLVLVQEEDIEHAVRELVQGEQQ